METPHKLVCSRGPAAGRLLHRSRSKCANLCSKCKMHANFTPKSFLSFRLQQRLCSRSWRQNDNVNVTVSRYQHCCSHSLICVRQLHGNYLLSFCSIFLCPKTLTWFSLAWFILTIYIPHNTPPRHVSSIWLGHVTWHKHILPHTLTTLDALLTADTRVPYPDGARVPAHAVAAARVAHAVLQHLAAVAPQARAEEE